MELKIKDSYFVAGSLWMQNPFSVIEQLCAQESKDGKVTASTLNKFNNDVFKSFGIWLEDWKTSHFLRACETKEKAEYLAMHFKVSIREAYDYLKILDKKTINKIIKNYKNDTSRKTIQST